MENPLRFSIATRIRDRYVKAMLKPSLGDSILDIGCGIGYYCEFLSTFSMRVVGIDRDPKAIEFSKGLYPDISFSVQTATSIDFKDSSFDKILCSEVLEHIEDDALGIREIRRVVKPKGLVLITVPCTEGVFGSRIKNFGHTDNSFEKHHRAGYTFNEIKSLLETNGLIVIRHCYTMTLFVELYMGITKLFFKLLNKEDLKTQADLEKVNKKSFFVLLNRICLPVLLLFGYFEDMFFSKLLKGHMLIIQARPRF